MRSRGPSVRFGAVIIVAEVGPVLGIGDIVVCSSGVSDSGMELKNGIGISSSVKAGSLVSKHRTYLQTS
jgi:hypothetical protein